jgi:hypothetical protein
MEQLKGSLATKRLTSCSNQPTGRIIKFRKRYKGRCRSRSSNIRDEPDRVTLPVMKKPGNHFDYYESAENDRTL